MWSHPFQTRRFGFFSLLCPLWLGRNTLPRKKMHIQLIKTISHHIFIKAVRWQPGAREKTIVSQPQPHAPNYLLRDIAPAGIEVVWGSDTELGGPNIETTLCLGTFPAKTSPSKRCHVWSELDPLVIKVWPESYMLNWTWSVYTLWLLLFIHTVEFLRCLAGCCALCNPILIEPNVAGPTGHIGFWSCKVHPNASKCQVQLCDTNIWSCAHLKPPLPSPNGPNICLFPSLPVAQMCILHSLKSGCELLCLHSCLARWGHQVHRKHCSFSKENYVRNMLQKLCADSLLRHSHFGTSSSETSAVQLEHSEHFEHTWSGGTF